MASDAKCNSDAEKKFISAVMKGDISSVQELFASDPKLVHCVHLAGCGSTPLHLAAAFDWAHIVEFLLKNGADPNARDYGDDVPLHRAANLNSFASAKLLFDNGADVNARSSWNRSPLHEAAHSGNEDMVELLLERGANVDLIDTRDCFPIDCVKEGNDRIVRLLQANSAIIKIVKSGDLRRLMDMVRDKNIKYRDLEDLTLLHHAVAHGHKDVVRFLVMHGADIHAVDNKLCTPLHHAALAGNADVFRLLVASGASLSAKNNDEKTPLEIATNCDILNDSTTEEKKKWKIYSFLNRRDIDVYEIGRFLDTVDLKHLFPTFKNEVISLEILSIMTEEDLCSIGIEDREIHEKLRKGIEDWENTQQTVETIIPLADPEAVAIVEGLKKCFFGSDYEIHQIKKLRNASAKARFLRRKDHIMGENWGMPNETILLHKQAFPTNTIATRGFDERYCSYSRGSGAGLYFEEEPFVGQNNCFKHGEESCSICLRTLFVGRVVLGKSHMNSTREDFGNPPPGFHSVTGKPSPDRFKAQHYVVFRGTQAYPEYEVTYKRRVHGSILEKCNPISLLKELTLSDTAS